MWKLRVLNSFGNRLPAPPMISKLHRMIIAKTLAGQNVRQNGVDLKSGKDSRPH